MINLDAVFAIEPSFNPFYEQSFTHRDVAELVDELDMESIDGEQ
jgi:hypothetical protein